MKNLLIHEALNNLKVGILEMMREGLFAYVLSGGVIVGRRKAVVCVCCLMSSAYRQFKEKLDADIEGGFCEKGRISGFGWVLLE